MAFSSSSRYSASDVLDFLETSEDDLMDDEPIMEGSDDDFEDLVIENNSYEDCQQDTSTISPTDLSNSPVQSPPISTCLPQTPIPSIQTSTPIQSPPISTSRPQIPIPSIQTSTPIQTSIQPPPNNSLPQTPIPSIQTSTRLSTVWSTNLHPVVIYPFTGTVGATFTVTNVPSDIFSHFFTDDLLHVIAQQSNLYASQVMDQHAYAKWDKITVSELNAYFGFCMLMSINHLPAIEDYWRTDPFLHYSPVADRISRYRFREISRYLHFVDNTQLPKRGEDNYDRLGKVRPIIQFCLEKFLSNYNPNCEMAIDEAMIPFQGRSSIKQYMPLKPTKRGFKVWVRADSHNGYFSEFSVYEGQTDSTNDSTDGLSSRVVKKLTRKVVGKFHHIFFDNFFSSPKLLQDLLEDNIYACGTARINRKGWPSDLKNKSKKYLRDNLQLVNRYI